MGKPKGKVNPKFSLSQIVGAVSEKLGVPVKFAPDCAKAAEAGFVNLKGHRLVGGMRASIYNAMPAEGVAKLVQFMEDFVKQYG